MFRRCVSLLVIAGFFASQLAAVPHAHGSASAEKQRQHDATRHFHCAWLGHSTHDHDHGHGHTHSGHGHSHHESQYEECSEPSSIDLDGQPIATALSSTGHDADAIFVSELTVTALTFNDQVVSAWQFAALPAVRTGFDEIQSSLCPSPRWHPPDEVLDASDTYLTLRNLRI